MGCLRCLFNELLFCGTLLDRKWILAENFANYCQKFGADKGLFTAGYRIRIFPKLLRSRTILIRISGITSSVQIIIRSHLRVYFNTRWNVLLTKRLIQSSTSNYLWTTQRKWNLKCVNVKNWLYNSRIASRSVRYIFTIKLEVELQENYFSLNAF